MSLAKISCIAGELLGKEINLKPGESVVLGRDMGICNLVFFDATVSRTHCEIRYTVDERYFVKDLSTYGLRANCEIEFKKEIEVEVPKGCILMIGTTGNQIQLL